MLDVPAIRLTNPLPQQIPPDLRALFDNDAPLELEIGCGKGAFLLRQARSHPDRNYVGIEWANKFYQYAADRMVRWGLNNVRIFRTDARDFVMSHLADASISAMHIYHPDPWPKKRHRRRRLIQLPFIDAAIRVLAPDARLAIQTDHAEYFSQIVTVTSARPELMPFEFTDSEFVTDDGNLNTNFEIKYLREGRPIYRLAFRKRGCSENC